jgi:hypothetical protein
VLRGKGRRHIHRRRRWITDATPGRSTGGSGTRSRRRSVLHEQRDVFGTTPPWPRDHRADVDRERGNPVSAPRLGTRRRGGRQPPKPGDTRGGVERSRRLRVRRRWVRLRGASLCEPCVSLVKSPAHRHLLRALAHKGGLRAQVLSEGTIALGDPIAAPMVIEATRWATARAS